MGFSGGSILRDIGIILVSIIFLGGLFLYQSKLFLDGNLHVVFCDVGQGDAIFIRTPKGMDIIVDGGPDDRIMQCLSDHMPFWDRTIDVMILSHPHQDHLAGLVSVLERYTVLHFVTERLINTTSSFQELERMVQKENLKTQYVLAGDVFRFGDQTLLTILGPTREYLENTSPSGLIGERSEFASLVIKLSYGSFDTLFTGDSQAQQVSNALMPETFDLEVFQVPHHGSRTGLNKEILDKIDPKFSVISVGKNSYGHPSKLTTEILRNKNTKILRTDKNGSIEFFSDGKRFWSRF